MKSNRGAIVLLAALLSGQTPPVFRVPVRIVEVPVAVTNTGGAMLRGLVADEFTLFDNDTPQRFELEEAGQAFSVVIAIQTNASARAWLPVVRASASAWEALLLGSMGEASILTFNDEVTVTQEMTSDVPHLDKAFRGLSVLGDKSRCLDAVSQAAAILGKAPSGNRRVLLLIAQQGDYGSKAELRDAVSEVERKNVTVYCLTMPRVGKDLLGSVRVSGLGQSGGRDTGFVISADLMKIVPEIYRGSKAAAGEDAVILLTSYTGGTMIPFRKRNDLDRAISLIGEELHTGYVLTYTPNDRREGYHRIRVAVTRSGAVVRSRPGYFTIQ